MLFDLMILLFYTTILCAVFSVAIAIEAIAEIIAGKRRPPDWLDSLIKGAQK